MKKTSAQHEAGTVKDRTKWIKNRIHPLLSKKGMQEEGEVKMYAYGSQIQEEVNSKKEDVISPSKAVGEKIYTTDACMYERRNEARTAKMMKGQADMRVYEEENQWTENARNAGVMS